MFISDFAFNPAGQSTISTLSHGIADNIHGLDRVGLGIRGYGVGREHGDALIARM